MLGGCSCILAELVAAGEGCVEGLWKIMTDIEKRTSQEDLSYARAFRRKFYLCTYVY